MAVIACESLLAQASNPVREMSLKTLLTGAPERHVIRKYDMTAVLANLPPILQNCHRSELLPQNAIRAARYFFLFGSH